MKDDPLFQRNSILIGIALSVVGLGFVDYVAGYELDFFLFYCVSIAMAAWKVGPISSYLVSILSSIVRFLSDTSSHPYSSVSSAAGDTMMRLLSFLTIAYFTSKIQFVVVKKRETSRDRLSQVKTLSGWIPICANCKKIRDDKEDWNRIEEYIEGRTNAQFTHGLCPECVDKLLKEARTCKLPKPAGSLLLGTV